MVFKEIMGRVLVWEGLINKDNRDILESDEIIIDPL